MRLQAFDNFFGPITVVDVEIDDRHALDASVREQREPRADRDVVEKTEALRVGAERGAMPAGVVARRAHCGKGVAVAAAEDETDGGDDGTRRRAMKAQH